MIKVRRGTFETNSSSTHTLIIPKKVEKPGKSDRTFTFSTDEYGWSFETHSLADYLWTAILVTEDYHDSYGLPSVEEWKERITEVLSPYYSMVNFEIPERDSWGDYYTCSIDHQSIDEAIDMLQDVWNDNDLLLNAILSGTALTGNDNSESISQEEYIEDCRDSGEYEIY